LPSSRPMERRPSLDGHKDAVAELAVHRLRQMPLAPRVLDENDLARADAPLLAVARGDVHTRVEIDDVLPPRRGMPVEVVVGLHLAEDDAVGGEPRRQLPRARGLGVLDLDVSPVRLALVVRVEIVDLHEAPRVLLGYRNVVSGSSPSRNWPTVSK